MTNNGGKRSQERRYISIRPKERVYKKKTGIQAITLKYLFVYVAGAPGIEPGNAGIKIRCLTAWRRPTIQNASNTTYSNKSKKSDCLDHRGKPTGRLRQTAACCNSAFPITI